MLISMVRGSVTRILLPFSMAGALLLGGQLRAFAQEDLPWWAQASLNPEDVGPEFRPTRADLSLQDGLPSYIVQFERTETGARGPSIVGSLLIRQEAEQPELSLDDIAAALVRQRTGLRQVEGPSFASKAIWFVGPWSEPPPVDEGLVLVAQVGSTVVSVAIVGAPGTVQPDEVTRYAGIVAERLVRLSPPPPDATPAPQPTPLPAATAVPLTPQIPLPFPAPTVVGTRVPGPGGR